MPNSHIQHAMQSPKYTNKHNCTWSKAQAQGRPGISCHCEFLFFPNALGNEIVCIEDAEWVAQIRASWNFSATV